jgi:hypothetical protein
MTIVLTLHFIVRKAEILPHRIPVPGSSGSKSLMDHKLDNGELGE